MCLNDYRYLAFVEKVWDDNTKRVLHNVTIYAGPKNGLGDGISNHANFRTVVRVNMRGERNAYALVNFVETHNAVPEGFAI